MTTRVESESFNPLAEFFENEEQEDEARGRNRRRRMPGPRSRIRKRFNVANWNRRFRKPRRFTRRLIRPFPRPFPRPLLTFPRPFPVPPPVWGPPAEPARPPVNQGAPSGSGSSGPAAAPVDHGWVPDDAPIEFTGQRPSEGNGQAPSVDSGVEPGDSDSAQAGDSAQGDDSAQGGDVQQPGGDEEFFEFFPQTEFADNEFGLTAEYDNWQRPLRGFRSRKRRRCNCQQGRSNSRVSRFGGYGWRGDLAGQGEVGMSEYESGASVVPQSVITMIKRGLVNAGLKLAVVLGFRSETQLTNLIFFIRHPERNGRAIVAGEPNYSALVREWIAIRDRVVRPALRRSAAPAGARPKPSAPSFPYQSTTVTPAPSGSAPDIVKVRGINVARQIAPQVEGLLAAAEAAGIKLSGGGYRSREAQIELRKKHCGTTQFDIFEKPSSQCTPPTAPPGRSQHEKGLAIDFTYGGTTIKSQTSPAFQWLKANAAKFGLYNLPSEPWHWSVNGK